MVFWKTIRDKISVSFEKMKSRFTRKPKQTNQEIKVIVDQAKKEVLEETKEWFFQEQERMKKLEHNLKVQKIKTKQKEKFPDLELDDKPSFPDVSIYQQVSDIREEQFKSIRKGNEFRVFGQIIIVVHGTLTYVDFIDYSDYGKENVESEYNSKVSMWNSQVENYTSQYENPDNYIVIDGHIVLQDLRGQFITVINEESW